MGRGVQAASTMGQIRTAIRTYALLDLAPAQVLRHTSELASAMSGRQFITCVYAIHDPVTQTLTYGNAGHPPPIVIGPDETPMILVERLGMPLGVGSMFEQRTVAFPAGSALLLYTDGLVERRGLPLPDGITRLDTAVRELLVPAAQDPASMCDQLIEQLTGGAHDDDVALLLARDIDVPRRIAMMPLVSEPVVASRARHFVADTLAEWSLTDPQDSAAMVVTELVSNAIRHTGAPIALHLYHYGERLVVEVLDEDDRPPRRMQPSLQDENHRGVYIVDMLTRRWGSRPTARGKVVWAELTLPDG
jgi:anti-sigma regulatory factor (Ser/Thr protein kinase)